MVYNAIIKQEEWLSAGKLADWFSGRHKESVARIKVREDPSVRRKTIIAKKSALVVCGQTTARVRQSAYTRCSDGGSFPMEASGGAKKITVKKRQANAGAPVALFNSVNPTWRFQYSRTESYISYFSRDYRDQTGCGNVSMVWRPFTEEWIDPKIAKNSHQPGG